MSYAKSIGLRVAAALFIFSIYGLAVSAAVNHVFSKPDTLKKALTESGMYPAVANDLVGDLVKEGSKKSGIQLEGTSAKAAAKTAVTPQVVEQNVEKVIDSTYSWLDGTTPTPKFDISTTSIQNQVAANVSDAAVNRVKGLPSCTYAQLQRINTADIDPFALECRPPGLDFAALRKHYKSQIASASASGELADKKITASDIKTQDGQNLFVQAEQVPKAFQFGQILPWLFGIGALVSGLLIVFLAEGKQAGLKSLSFTVLLAAALLVFSVIATTMIARAFKLPADGASADVQQAVLATIKTLTGAINRAILVFAGIYAALGIAGLVSTRFMTVRKAATTPSIQADQAALRALGPEQAKRPRRNKK